MLDRLVSVFHCSPLQPVFMLELELVGDLQEKITTKLYLTSWSFFLQKEATEVKIFSVYLLKKTIAN